MANRQRIGTVYIDRQKLMKITAKKALTTANIQAALGVSQARTSVILSGAKPISATTAKRIADTLGCDLEDIIVD